MARIIAKQIDGICKKPIPDAFSAFMRHCQLKNLSPYVSSAVHNIGTAVLNGGVSMLIFFFVNKIIFPAAREEAAE